jgi:hypothetical protein
MKKTIISFIIVAFLLAALILWALGGGFNGNIQEILMVAGVLIMVGFALLLGVRRVKSHMHKEPAEDELSKQVMMRASSLSFYISLYFWLAVMYISDRSPLPTHSLIGAGIMGMAIIFLFSWIWVKVRGTIHE